MSNSPLNELSAVEVLDQMASGIITAEELTTACLERIEKREQIVQAWVYLDPERALSQARQRDRERQAGGPIGPLHGVPIALKDIFDTYDMPTAFGSNRFEGRQPLFDSFAAQLLRQAGAIIMGKAVTTEIAMLTPGKTRNPHDPARTPGGSSSGSCAAVGDNMVPLALGSQTSGSTLRPASFCGIHGYKPTFGYISRTGVSPISRKLDHVGSLARSLEDLAVINDVLMVYDPRDEEMPGIRPQNLSGALRRPFSGTPTIGFARTPFWNEGDEEAFRIFEEFIKSFGTIVQEIELPKSFNELIEHHDNVMGAGLAYYYAEEVERTPPLMQKLTLDRIEAGLSVTAGAYLKSLSAVDRIRKEVGEAICNYDAVIVAPATGEAPLGHSSTGNPVFQAPWTLLGLPGLCLPLLKGPNGLPFGVQLMAQKGEDAKLFRIAKWIEAQQI